MTEQLEHAIVDRNIQIINKTRVIKILTKDQRSEDQRSYGILCLEEEKNFTVCFCKNIIFATGGPPGLYGLTVYPPSQFGASGILVREGVVFSNITEWQYGIGSTKFRWNLSGSYQQVIPRYVSVDEKGREEEFLPGYFSSMKNMGRAVFLKGYQWPFDPAKIAGEGSSLVDMAIYVEKYIKGRKIFLDYTANPQGFVLDEIDETAREYLAKSDALCPTPLERLLRLNPLSYELYKSNGIDLAREYLEIDVLPQHNNGGAEVNIWWETSVKHLFAVGECAGTHGVHRPGGSALNSGQVGGLRAASFIAGNYLKEDAFYGIEELKSITVEILEEFEKELAPAFESADLQSADLQSTDCKSVAELLGNLQKMNARTAKFIRSRRELEKSREELKTLSEEKINPWENIHAFFRFREMLLFSRILYDGILYYINSGGKSRGSYLLVESLEDIEACLGGVEIDASHKDKVLNTVYIPKEDRVISSQRQVRPIPESDTWFEKVWREYREGEVFKL
jgi:succinate dehydrogenase/fumarate reductase flavoprotein subunit